MADFTNNRFHSPPLTRPPSPNSSGPVPVRPLPFSDPPDIVREIPIGVRPPVPRIGPPPVIGPLMNPAQRMANIFRQVAQDPSLMARLQAARVNPIVAEALRRRRLSRF